MFFFCASSSMNVLQLIDYNVFSWLFAIKMKEMVGGCCVCSDERGWPENPLVYCDGSQCK